MDLKNSVELTLTSTPVTAQKPMTAKAVDELREILRKDEDVREFFILLKNKELRAQAVEKLNQHLGRLVN